MTRPQLLWAICKQLGPDNSRMPLVASELARLQMWQLEWLYRQGMPTCLRHRCLKRDRKHCVECGREYSRRHLRLKRSLDAQAERLWSERYAMEEAAYYGRPA